jgi:hypothetical protein
MFNAVNTNGKKYTGFHDNNMLIYTCEGHKYIKKLSQLEETYMQNYNFTIVNDTECICKHSIIKETDCNCDLSGFSVYICHKESAYILRDFTHYHLK